MKRASVRQHVLCGLALVAAPVVAAGCGEDRSDVTGEGSDGLALVNGLAFVNGLSSTNGLALVNGLPSSNGLALVNGLSSINGLSSGNGLMTTAVGRKTVAYLVKCALAANDSLSKADQNGVNYTFPGGVGLCPAWKNGGISGNAQCLEGISACLMASVNTAGVHVPLWMDSNDSVIGWGIDRVNYPMQEGTFFGDILDTGSLASISKPGVTAPVAYYCDGAGFPAGASGVVAGRLGANQAGAPYKNPFGTGVLCQNAPSGAAIGQFSMGVGGSCPPGSSSNPAAGCPDGYKALTTSTNGGTWQHGITVWRNNNYTPVFDAGYVYRLSPYGTNGGQSVDVANGSTSNGAAVDQYASWNGLPEMFNLLQNGSYWHIAMNANNAKCIDLVGGTTANATQLAINDCNGASASQNWQVTADAATGAFIFKNVAAGRCLEEPYNNTSSGVRLDIWDCLGTSPQKFIVQAIPMN
jgi:hypothetical protein